MRTLAELSLLAFLLPAVAVAGVVHVPYSGQLAQDGSPLTGTHAITVALYQEPGRGLAVHVQTESLSVVQGVFHMDLAVQDAVFANNDSLWAGVAVDGGIELEPRIRVGAVPYAVRALLPTTAPMPGVAFANSFPPVDVPATVTWVPVAQLPLVAPADGFVWLTASGHWQERSNTLPNYVGVEFILGEDTPPPIDQHQQYYSFFQFREWPFSHTTVLPATTGSHTYTLWVRVTASGFTLSQSPAFYASTMQALWVPVSYAD